MKEIIDDLVIVNELKNNSNHGITLLIDKYYGKLKKYTLDNYFSLIEIEDSEEIISDTFIDAFKSIHQFTIKNETSLQSWLIIILKNKLIDLYNKKKKRKENINLIYFDENDDCGDILDDIDKGNIEVTKDIISKFTSSGVKEDERNKIIYNIMNEFTREEQSDLWAYFNGIKHEESALYRKISLQAYKKRITRLAQIFFNKVGENLNKDGKIIYEKFKEIN